MHKQANKTAYIFNKNIKKIQKEQLVWQGYMIGAGQDEKLIAIKSNNKQTTYKYIFDNEEKYISGQNNPSSTAKEIVKIEYDKRVVNKKFKAATTAMAFVCDPYIVQELLATYKWVKDFFMVFPSASYFTSLLFSFDFSCIIENKAFKPIFSDEVKKTIEITHAALFGSNFSFSGLMLFAYSPFDVLFTDVYKKAKDAILKATEFSQVNLNTVLALGNQMKINELRSLDKVFKYPTVSVLKDKMKGKPIICVAAGPSLNQHLDFLKKIQNEVFIISVVASAKTLLNNGIKPDLLTSIDMEPLVLNQLEGLDVSQIPIVIEMACHHSTVDNVNTDFIFSMSSCVKKNFLVKLTDALGITITSDDFVISAFTVAITSLLCAQLMGASEIFLIGQDLAISGDSSHAKDTVIANKVEIVDDGAGGKLFMNTSLFDSKQTLSVAIEVPGYYGDKVYTTASMKAFLDYFEKVIKDNNIENVYNATEGGAYIEGAENISLQEAYERFIKNNKLDSKNIGLVLKKKKISKTKAEQVVKNLKAIITNMEKAEILAKEGLDLIESFMKLYKKDNKEYAEELKLSAHVEKINKIANTLNKEYAYEVNTIAQLSEANYYLFKLLNSVNTLDYSEEALMADMQNKFVLFFANVHEGLKIIITELEGVITRIKEEHILKKGDRNV